MEPTRRGPNFQSPLGLDTRREMPAAASCAPKAEGLCRTIETSPSETLTGKRGVSPRLESGAPQGEPTEPRMNGERNRAGSSQRPSGFLRAAVRHSMLTTFAPRIPPATLEFEQGPGESVEGDGRCSKTTAVWWEKLAMD